MRKYLAYYENEWPANIAELTAVKNKPFVGVCGREVQFTVIPPPTPETWKIYYTSSYGNVVTPSETNVFGANIVSNTYEDGKGVIMFDNSVTSIGSYAFGECSSLTSIIIPNSVTSIGQDAFYSCSSLTEIVIPNSVTSIKSSAFSNCNKLAKTNYIGDIADWCNIEFMNPYANPIYYSHNFYINGQEIKDLIIPNSVTSIGTYAFFSCSSLTSVTIPNSVKSIGGSAFRDCSGLTSVTIPNSVTSIGGMLSLVALV